ncbi:hypothetical protein G6F35_010018 [Rhizopus arrhizus]|nr:hypothetical protein G6F35_010018 [Rhizopus arrhizus]
MLDVLVDRPVERGILLGHRADRRQHRQRRTIGHARQQPRLCWLAAITQRGRQQEQHVVAKGRFFDQALFDALARIRRGRRERARRRLGDRGAPMPPHGQHHAAHQHARNDDPARAHQLWIAVSVAAAAS